MSGQLSDFLAARSQRVGDLWMRLGAAGHGSRGPRPFVNAVLVALTTDDLTPLRTYFELDTAAPDIDQRLDQAIRQLRTLGHAVHRIAGDEGAEAGERLDLAWSTGEGLADIVRRLAVTGTAELSRQLHGLSRSSSARGSSLSITIHELRRPLTILNSYGQLLSSGMLGAMPESAAVAIEGITASTEMMVHMVGALAEVSRLEDPEDEMVYEKMSVSELVAGAIEHVALEAKLRGATLESDVSDGALTIRGDRRRLTLALTNMLSNAVKHGPEGSKIIARAVAERDLLHLSVTDRGPGFPPEDGIHLFDKYYRSSAERQRKVPGSGLGLFIVKTVAERHHGRVSARSTPGEGAQFEMILPLGSEER